MTYTTFTRPVWQWLRSPELDGCLYFGIPYEIAPTTGAADVVRANSRFAAGYPWPLRETMMNALDTHDLQRFAHHAGPGEQLVALALAVGLPGIPVVYAGDEFRLPGVNGEDSRTPMPWGARHDEAFVDRYAEILKLRATQTALCEGGLRHLYMDEHTLVFERATADGGVLVAVSTAAFDVVIDGVTPADRLSGTALADAAATGARISGGALSWGFWRLA